MTYVFGFPIVSYLSRPRRSESDNLHSRSTSPSISMSSGVSVPRTATTTFSKWCRTTTKYTVSWEFFCTDEVTLWVTKPSGYQLANWFSNSQNECLDSHRPRTTWEIRPCRRASGGSCACFKKAAACPLHQLSPSSIGLLNSTDHSLVNWNSKFF